MRRGTPGAFWRKRLVAKKEHTANEDCWCNPVPQLVMTPQGDRWIYIHNKEKPSNN